jgi:hypothetical protein
LTTKNRLMRFFILFALALQIFQSDAKSSENPSSPGDCPHFAELRELWKSGNEQVYVAAHMSDACADDFRASEGANAKSLFIDSGFVSALFGLVADEVLAEFLESIVEAGDHGYFALDKELIDQLDNFAARGAISHEKYIYFRNFVVSAQQAEPNLTEALSSTPQMLEFVPIWQSAEDRLKYVAACKESDCGGTVSNGNICEFSDFAAVKRLFAVNSVETRILIRKCDLNLPQFLGLRRFGIIDSTCSMSMQLEAVAEINTALDEPCAERFRNLNKRAALGSNDIVRYFRFVSDQKNRNSISSEVFVENAKLVSNYSKKLSDEILEMK